MKKFLLVITILFCASSISWADSYTFKEVFLGAKDDAEYFKMAEKSQSDAELGIGYRAKFDFDLAGPGDKAVLFGIDDFGDTIKIEAASPNPDEQSWDPNSNLVITEAYLNFFISDIDDDREKIRMDVKLESNDTEKIMAKSYNLTSQTKFISIDLLAEGFLPELLDGEFLALGLAPAFGDIDNDFNIDRIALVVKAADPVPEPATFALFGLGLIGLGTLRRRISK